MAAEPISAVAQAVGQIFGTISTFAAAGAQKFGLQKGIEAEGISASRAKSVAAYQGIASTQKTILYLLIAFAIVVLIVKARK